MIRYLKSIFFQNKINENYIIVFANYNYLLVLENWLEAVRRIDVSNFIIISLDEKLHNYLTDKNINSRLRPCELDLGKLWIHRIEVIEELLCEGYDIIHSDADAIWLKNPIPYLNQIDSEMIFSQGTYWPADVYNRWKFVLCCGFFYIKNTKNTLKFVKKLKERVRVDKDDQVSCNRELLEENIEWLIPKDSYTLEFRSKKFLCFNKPLQGKSNLGTTIALLPHHKFQRIPELSNDIYVKHIISEKNSEDIMDILTLNECRFI
jgi:hypothetical protein